MTAVTKTTIKGYFETGDKPTQAQFVDFIDSCAFLAETSSQTFVGGVSVSGAITGYGGGTLNGFTLNSPTVSAAILNTPTINTPVVSAGTFASPSLTGTPVAPTAAVNTSTTQIATTAFVLSQAASAGEMEAGTNTTKYATPSGVLRSQGAVKAYGSVGFAGGTPSLNSGSFNITSVSDQGQGQTRINLTNPMSTTSYFPTATITGAPGYLYINIISSAAYDVVTLNTAASATDVPFYTNAFGDI